MYDSNSDVEIYFAGRNLGRKRPFVIDSDDESDITTAPTTPAITKRVLRTNRVKRCHYMDEDLSRLAPIKIGDHLAEHATEYFVHSLKGAQREGSNYGYKLTEVKKQFKSFKATLNIELTNEFLVPFLKKIFRVEVIDHTTRFDYDIREVGKLFNWTLENFLDIDNLEDFLHLPLSRWALGWEQMARDILALYPRFSSRTSDEVIKCITIIEIAYLQSPYYINRVNQTKETKEIKEEAPKVKQTDTTVEKNQQKTTRRNAQYIDSDNADKRLVNTWLAERATTHLPDNISAAYLDGNKGLSTRTFSNISQKLFVIERDPD